MRPAVPALLLMVLAAGCAAPPAPTPEPGSTVIDLTGQFGLIAVDVEAGRSTPLSESAPTGWLSPSGSYVVWPELNYFVLFNVTNNSRHVVSTGQYVRIYDNQTGLELAADQATWRNITGGVVVGTTPLPPAPAEGSRWTTASDDLETLGAEYASPRPTACANDLFLRAAQNARTTGCHLRVAPDGRAGWTESAGVRVMARDGTITNLTGPGGGDASQGAYVAHENPLFPANGTLFLRVTGGAEVLKTEIVRDTGEVLARMEGQRRLALLDTSTDGTSILVRAFER